MHAGSHPRSRAQGSQPPLQWGGSGFFSILFSAPPPHRPPGGGSRGRGQGPGSSSNSSSTWRGARPEAASRAPSPAHTPTCPGAPSPTSSSSPSLCRQVPPGAHHSTTNPLPGHGSSSPSAGNGKTNHVPARVFSGSARAAKARPRHAYEGRSVRPDPKEAPEAKAENETGRSNETKRCRQPQQKRLPMSPSSAAPRAPGRFSRSPPGKG